MKAIGFLYIHLFLLTFSAFSQQKYWILFNDKGAYNKDKCYVSKTTIQNRRLLGLELKQVTDVPVSKLYLDSLNNTDGIQVVNTSKWLNAVSAVLSSSQIDALKGKPFVKKIIPVTRQIRYASLPIDLSDLNNLALEQINTEKLRASATGKKVKIGVIDGDFKMAPKTNTLTHLFENQQIIETRNFNNPLPFSDFFDKPNSSDDNHGTAVLQMIAGLNQTTQKQFGLALDAHYYLARTEILEQETRVEEDNWIAALEWMDSLGVRLINSSLGYSQDFDNPEEDYFPEQMNGEFSRIAQAAQIATKEKGIILVVAAGNEGENSKWKVIVTPADARGVLSIGSTDLLGQKLDISSIGSANASYLKPNLACYSSHGTSLSAPVITGLIACMLEINEALSSEEISRILEESSNLFPYGNNFLGYGIPNGSLIFKSLKSTSPLTTNNKEIEVKGKRANLSCERCEGQKVVIFHKIDDRMVDSQLTIDAKTDKVLIKKPDGIKRSTVVFPESVYEITWK